MLFAVTYGVGTAAFTALLVLILLGRRPEGPGRHIVLACGLTTLWSCAAAFSGWRLAGLAYVLESVRSVGWLYFISALLGAAKTSEGVRGQGYFRPLALVLGVVAVGNDLRFVTSAASPVELDFSQIIGRNVLAVAGILLVENLFRNTSESRRWHVAPLCIAIGGLFAYDLFLYSDALLFRRVDMMLLTARGVVVALIVPPLVLTMVRNRDWRIDIHVSRQIVFHSATLLASGVFLLAVAAMAIVLRRLPGDWGALLEVVFLFGSVLVLATVLSSGTFRSRMTGFLARNLFSHRYDYRVEWMRFVDTVSHTDDSDSLHVRVIRAIANIMDSPGGVIWMWNEAGIYRPFCAWNMRFDPAHYEPETSPFIAAFKDGTAIQELNSPRGSPPSTKMNMPEWAKGGPPIWLVVPLRHRDRILGFVTLAPARAPFTLNWENGDLLLAVGKQVASYLSEEQVARALADARLLTEYSRRFAFVVHDIKNLVSQLSMTVTNARKHGNDTEFREDMLRTLINSVARMKELLSKLRTGGGAAEKPTPIDPSPVIASVVEEIGRGRVTVLTDGNDNIPRVAIRPSTLRSALTHLVTNALEASQQGKGVIVRSRMTGEHVIIEVQDGGPGMEEKFIREELFRPFHSTKSEGHGIGAYQTREQVREAGGELQVMSSPGAGTTVRIVLPSVTQDQPSDPTASVLTL